MADTRTVIRTFLASPGDVGPERDAASEIVSELNAIWSKFLGLTLELIRWETHAYPGIGDDAQFVINEEIADDYDLFVGIMWMKFGTPTQRAGSGTEEEFNRAYQRYTRDPQSVRIMFYFKSPPSPTDVVDQHQIEAVAAFRQKVGNQGVLYWTFQDEQHFATLLRMHLSLQMQHYHGQFTGKSNTRVSSRWRNPLRGEMLLLPFRLLLQQWTVLKELNRFNAAMDNSGAVFASLGKDIQTLGPTATRGDLQLLLNKRASSLSDFVAQTTPVVGQIEESFSRFMDSVARAAPLFVGGGPSVRVTRWLILKQLRVLQDSILSGIPAFRELQSAILLFGQVDAVFHEPVREAVALFDQVVDVWMRAHELVLEAERTYSNL
jgi:hypothetical protein